MAGFKRKAKRVTRELTGPPDQFGPSPNALTNLIIADIALRGGNMFVRRGIERALLRKRYTPEKARSIMKGRTFMQSMAGAALARAATMSVPGALIVGGGLLAKTLYDRRKDRTAMIQGEAALESVAQKAEKQEA